ncbi:MAG: glycosyltransferase [Clostridiales bacterium]|nr:glycosyltransferase [Clostridiales bacterium]
MKVSVVIPVYNVEPYIKECLDSVRQQSLGDLEIICIHDAGTDGSWELVKEAASSDPRFRLFENERNMGLAATRNRGLQVARAPYVYFLDSDDKIRPDALETLYGRAIRERLDVQIFGASFIYESSALREKFHSNPAHFKREYPEILSGREVFVRWMEYWDWMPSQPRYFYSREFLEQNQIRYTEGMLHEDETFAFDVLMHADSVRVSSEEFFIRRFRADSIMTGRPTMKNVEGCAQILAHVSAMHPFFDGNPELEKAVRYYLYKIFRDACGKYRTAVQTAEQEDEERPDGNLHRNTEAADPDCGASRGDDRERSSAEAARRTAFDLIAAFGLWEEGEQL